MTKCYIGRKVCGCIVAATVIDGREPKQLAKDVAEFIEDGLAIEKVDVEYVRLNFQAGCPHEKPKVPKEQGQLL